MRKKSLPVSSNIDYVFFNREQDSVNVPSLGQFSKTFHKDLYCNCNSFFDSFMVADKCFKYGDGPLILCTDVNIYDFEADVQAVGHFNIPVYKKALEDFAKAVVKVDQKMTGLGSERKNRYFGVFNGASYGSAQHRNIFELLRKIAKPKYAYRFPKGAYDQKFFVDVKNGVKNVYVKKGIGGRVYEDAELVRGLSDNIPANIDSLSKESLDELLKGKVENSTRFSNEVFEEQYGFDIKGFIKKTFIN